MLDHEARKLAAVRPLERAEEIDAFDRAVFVVVKMPVNQFTFIGVGFLLNHIISDEHAIGMLHLALGPLRSNKSVEDEPQYRAVRAPSAIRGAGLKLTIESTDAACCPHSRGKRENAMALYAL